MPPPIPTALGLAVDWPAHHPRTAEVIRTLAVAADPGADAEFPHR
ncbi:hypothetical protein ACWGDE_01900 [Streptomyces sp. NPDC054956]